MTHQGLALLLVTGVLTGLLNTLAGGGSFLSMPMLIFLGQSPGVANGTNRLAIVAQNLSGVWGFHRYQALPWRWAGWTVLPTALGSLAGTWLALATPDSQLRRLLAVFMATITLWTLISSRRGPSQDDSGGAGAAEPPAFPRGARRWLVQLGFFASGIYGGFIQAGVGFLLLAVLSFAGLDLVRANAVKVLAILVNSLIALPGFILAGRVEWLPGLVLALGTMVGARWGVRLTILKGQRWLRWVVTVAVLLCAIKLWLG